MEIFAPDYYKKFRCIADKCRHSCCIGWDIYIDGATYEKYKRLDNPIKDELLLSLEDSEDGIRFCATDSGRCPMLDGSGLCRLITAVGEGYLSEICTLHPRFITEKKNRREIGLGLACEEAARLALLGKEYPKLIKIGECDDPCMLLEYDSSAIRDSVVDILSGDIKLSEKIRLIENKFSISTSIYSDSEWIDFLSSLEILDNEWLKILSKAQNAIPKTDIFESLSIKSADIIAKFMIYLASRHIFAAESEIGAKSAVGFALLGGRILALLTAAFGLAEEETVDFARLYSSEIEYSESNTEQIMFEFQISF